MLMYYYFQYEDLMDQGLMIEVFVQMLMYLFVLMSTLIFMYYDDSHSKIYALKIVKMHLDLINDAIYGLDECMVDSHDDFLILYYYNQVEKVMSFILYLNYQIFCLYCLINLCYFYDYLNDFQLIYDYDYELYNYGYHLYMNYSHQNINHHDYEYNYLQNY